MATLDAVRRLGMVQPEVIESTRHSPELATHDRFDNRSNASGELGFEDALAQMVGPEGRGVPTIIDMVNSTRGNVAIWAVSLMRQSVAQAGWHVAHRSAFGAKLIDKPLMVNVLADMELEVEAATLMMARLPSAGRRVRAVPPRRRLGQRTRHPQPHGRPALHRRPSRPVPPTPGSILKLSGLHRCLVVSHGHGRTADDISDDKQLASGQEDAAGFKRCRRVDDGFDAKEIEIWARKPELVEIAGFVEHPLRSDDAVMHASMLDIGRQECVPERINRARLIGHESQPGDWRRVLPHQPEFMEHDSQSHLVVAPTQLNDEVLQQPADRHVIADKRHRLDGTARRLLLDETGGKAAFRDRPPRLDMQAQQNLALASHRSPVVVPI